MKLLDKVKNILGQHGKELLRGSSIAFLIKFLAAITSLVFNIYLARKIGSEEAGYFFLSLSVITIVAGVSRLGLDNSVVKIFAFLNSKGEKPESLYIYRKVVGIIAISGFFASALLFVLSETISTQILKVDERNLSLIFMIIATPFLSMTLIHAQILQGFKKIGLSVSYLSLFIPLLTLILVFSLDNQDASAVAASYLVSSVCVAISALIYSKFSIVAHTKKIKQPFKTGELLKSSLPLLVVFITSLSILWGGQLFLGAFASAKDVTIYQVLNRTSYLISFVLIAFNRIASPKMSESYNNHDFGALKTIISITNKSLFILTTPLIVLIAIFRVRIVGLIGDEFTESSHVLLILCLGQYFNVISGSVGNLLMMTNNEKLHMYSAITSLIVMISLNVLLVPNLGVLGGALAAAIAMTVQNVMGVLFVKKALNINILKLTFSKKLNYDTKN